MISIRHHPLTLLVVATISSPVLYGQDATVRRATAETTDGIVVTVELTRQNLRFGQNIVANYRVKNNSKSPIYLFRRKGPLDVWSSGRTIVIDVPLPWPIEHGEYDYIFVEVKPNQTSQARFVLTERTTRSPEIGYSKPSSRTLEMSLDFGEA